MVGDIDTTQGAIIASMMLFPREIERISSVVQEEWFTGAYRRAFRYISEHGGSDCVAVAGAIGVPASEVLAWQDLEFTATYIPQHLANLEQEATARKIQYLGQQLLKVGNIDEAMTLIDRFGNSLSAKDKTEPEAIKAGLLRLSKELERRYNSGGQLLGMTTGLVDLDAATEGLHRGDLVVVAGPSSMGKTAFALGVVESAAEAGHRALVFSCEMTTEQLLMRSLSARADIPLYRIRSARFQDHEWKKVATSIGELATWPIQIDDPAGITLSELTRKIRRAVKNGLDIVLIDYLQIMKYDKSKEVHELDEITTSLKNLAKELNVCIILLSQLNRTSEKEKRKPAMSDLRGSGMIENNADVILFPYREAANCEKCREKVETAEHSTSAHQAKAEVIIGKQRQGERNVSVPLVWIGEKTRFVSVSHSGQSTYGGRYE